MTLLSRISSLGIAKEITAGTYVAPARWLPVSDAGKPEDHIDSLMDESVRGNRTNLQDIYPGASHSTFDYTVPFLYPDTLGDHLRAIIGVDTVTAGVSTTLSASTTAGATSITTAATITSGSAIQIDTGTTIEWATTGTPSGAGPYTIPITSGALKYAHATTVTVISATTHTFKQTSAQPPTYSLHDYDGSASRGYPGCVLGDLGIKIDPQGATSYDAKWMGQPSATQSAATASYSSTQPHLGWTWSLTQGGVTSTRGLSADITIKQDTDAIWSSDGTQGPREIFAGAVSVDFKLKAIYEDATDRTLFTNYQNQPLVITLTQPALLGGSVLTFTSTRNIFTKFNVDRGGKYATADIEAHGTYSATDTGPLAVSLKSYLQTAY